MKKVVNEKLYDTENAEMFCENCFSNVGDFKHVYEALYKSSNGQFFIEFSGGPMSKYRVNTGQNEVSGSDGIRLITKDDAKEFMEEHGDTEGYVKAFGTPEIGQESVIEIE